MPSDDRPLEWTPMRLAYALVQVEVEHELGERVANWVPTEHQRLAALAVLLRYRDRGLLW